MSTMESLNRPVVFVILVLGLFGASGLRDAKAQTPGGNAAAQKPLYARLGWKRAAASDLEIDGDLLGTPSHTTRYATREQLLALPQVSFTVTNDANFRGPTEISGVALDELLHASTEKPESEMVVAVCSDK
ncbi:MAG TPA: hypothetical protein VHP80_17185, partial [Candidatus Acidoferrum sp.]|nr:hypothetical protein [Candidatus Acidoferrum sp.]